MQKELKVIQASLSRFERFHGKTSESFLTEYQAGTAGDTMDFVEWAALIKMRDSLQ